LIAQQYIGQLASRPWWQAWLGAIYPVLGVITLVLLGVVSLRASVAQPGADRTGAVPPDSGLAAAS
jgi:hypothetical protein